MIGVTGDLGVRCACRPGCLTWLRRTDDLVVTVAGAALAAHLPDWQPPATRVVPLTFDFPVASA